MFLVEKNEILYVAPIQYNARADHWINYYEDSWDKRPWNKYCGGCHAMGIDLEKNTLSEPSVGCEACHGPGSHHVALPETAVFDKRLTIVNPSHLPVAFRTQICGSCHNRGKSTKVEEVEWPVGYRPGRALGLYYKSTSYAAGDFKNVYANEFAKGHHQQYLDWQHSSHSREGVTCTSCHYVHQLGLPPTQFQTKGAGSQQCLTCHQVINNNLAHSIHSFANCIGCHMPRISQSAESGDTHSHVFVTLLPKDTLANPNIPNSCQTCHKHKDTDLATLQKLYDSLTQKSLVHLHQPPRTRQ
jgi:formate-dependent nitrite reductase cytochrome c552 subunit